MNVSNTATARFAKVVEVAGKPEVVSLWTRPERDKNFMTAVQQNRLMTLKQETAGSTKDFGIVGFAREKNVSYLVFPRSLKDFQDRRIVGIKYALIATPAPIGRVIKPTKPKSKESRKRGPAEWRFESEAPAKQPLPTKGTKTFTVHIRFNATADVREKVEARSRKEAKELGLQQAVMPDLRRGTVTRKVVKVADRS
jgi:hypothetical protein